MSMLWFIDILRSCSELVVCAHDEIYDYGWFRRYMSNATYMFYVKIRLCILAVHKVFIYAFMSGCHL
uniref:Uncharacterized protein n=1 Tax=Arundo donax TaxID=35708 RepID=A0A0A9FYH2_ARUDO